MRNEDRDGGALQNALLYFGQIELRLAILGRLERTGAELERNVQVIVERDDLLMDGGCLSADCPPQGPRTQSSLRPSSATATPIRDLRRIEVFMVMFLRS